jgi:nitrogen fixation protein FixH
MNTHGLRHVSRQGFTGGHMLALMGAFFGVVIAVNMTIATLARTSWTGLVVPNSYVASQGFNARLKEARAQALLGWTPSVTLAAGELRFMLTQDGRRVGLAGAEALVHRPVSGTQDRVVELAPTSDGDLAAPLDLEPGVWIVETHARTSDGRAYRDIRRMVVSAEQRP